MAEKEEKVKETNGDCDYYNWRGNSHFKYGGPLAVCEFYHKVFSAQDNTGKGLNPDCTNCKVDKFELSKIILEKRVKENSKKYIEEIAQEIKKYFRGQKEDWQKVPWLALQANGRGGYSSGYSIAYEIGLEMINDSVFVDLESGDLVNPPWGFCSGDDFNKVEPALSNSIFVLAEDLERYSAKNKIQQLEEVCLRKDNPFYLTEGNSRDANKITSTEWRNSEIKKYGLKKNSYKRKIII